MIRALFGGSFDPFHCGHLAMIRTILARGLADEVILTPAGHNPHKPAPPTPAAHRVRMVELGTAGLPGVRVLDREARRGGPSYTVDTLASLVAEHPGDAWRLVLGADNLAGLRRWRDPERVLAMAQLLVFPRGGQPVSVPEWLAGRMLVVTGFATPVSATRIRSLLAAGERPEAEVPPPVLDYITAHGLYRRTNPGGSPAPGREDAPCP